MYKEDHQKICNSLVFALRSTRQYNDLISLTYVLEDENNSHVEALFPGGVVKINTSMDSGWAMIKDIIDHLPH